MMNLELKQSTELQNSHQLDMLVHAGLEHAKTILAVESLKKDLGDSISSIADNFADGTKDKNINKKQYTKWMYVKDKSGKVCGRYRIRLEDEAAKVNISKARLLKDGKGTSWDTSEINLPRALGLPTKFAKKIIRYRYGPNWMPGGRHDDDHNNIVLIADGIDNDADGKVDEADEGINDSREYVADNLKGDDRKFTTMSEALGLLLKSKKPLALNIQKAIQSDIPRRATVYSYDKTGSSTLQNEKPSDINCMTARECRNRIIAANKKNLFEANSKKRTQLAANIVDYRDENHVLSTLGSTYGVEAVCFNEVMANDESYTINPELGALPGGDPGVHYTGEDPWDERWKSRYGSVDGGRLIYRVDLFYNCVPDDPLMPYTEFYYNLDPRKGWRVKNNDPNTGDLNINKRKITFSKYPGEFGNRLSIEPYPYTKGASYKPPESLPGRDKGKRYLDWPRKNANALVFGSKNDYEKSYEDTMDVLKKIGQSAGTKPDFPDGYFKNSLAMIYGWMKDDKTNPKVIGCFKIIDGDEDFITFESKDEHDKTKTFEEQLAAAGMTEGDYDLSVTINSWGNRSPFAMVPEANVTYLMRSRQPKAGQYFQVIIGRPPQGRWVSASSYPKKLGVSGKVSGGFTEDKRNLNRRWLYKEGKPIRTKQGGWIDIMLTSDPGISRENKNRQWIGYFRMVAPEVSEMYNASATPVSLANWRIICNTGSTATEIGRIKSTTCYDKKLRKTIVDNNPVVHPGDHFYLVNNTELFDYWYGSGNGKWGGGPKEAIPVFQMDEENWGITYKIKSARYVLPHTEGAKSRAGVSIILEEQNLDKETFNLETIKFIDRKNAENIHSWNNIFAPVISEDIRTENEVFIAPIGDSISEIVGTSVMVLGLPHAGGIVSLTLKNEYEQICARTVDYGKVDALEIGRSCEKIDPTKDTWVKRRESTIGGYKKKALNLAMKTRRDEKFFIKNGPYCSVGEMMHVTTGGDFERLGGGGNISKSATALGALAGVMCSSYVRLESCAGNVSRTGWQKASDEVESSTKSTVACKNGGWKVDQWKGQTLRFLTGKLRGEKFPIIGNTKNIISVGDKRSVDPTYSVPDRLSLSPAKGDKFCLGPGYASAFCFTKTGGEEGEWTWKNALPNVSQASRLTVSKANKKNRVPEGRGMLNLYIHGLSDAIDTTEFFEENNNASLNVEVWNWKTQKFDKLKKRGRYGKQDSFNAGKINPEHISDSGDFRLKLIAYDVAEKNLENKHKKGEPKLDYGGRQTGIAWFNYAVITPVPVSGRVNINTASARMLASLPGINGKLAKNIEAGINTEGKNKLKPYNSIGDVFKVRGMTPEIFERCANILTVESSIFTVEVEAETFKISPTLKGVSEGRGMLSRRPNIEEIAGVRKKRFVIELDKTDDGYASITELEQYSP